MKKKIHTKIHNSKRPCIILFIQTASQPTIRAKRWKCWCFYSDTSWSPIGWYKPSICPGGGGKDQKDPPGLSDLKFEACSPLKSIPFDLMQIKVWKRKMWLFDKRCSIFLLLDSILIYIPIWVYKHMFSTNFSSICCILAQNKVFEKSKMAAKMADMLWNDLNELKLDCYYEK